MYIECVDLVYKLNVINEVVRYGDDFLESERQFSAYNFEHAKTDFLFDQFREAQEQCKELLTAKLPLPAYDHAIKASHLFNLLNARGVISVAERQAYIARVRELAKRSEEHTSELQSLMRNSYAVFCLKKKTKHKDTLRINHH